MNALLIKLLNMSAAGSVLILAVVVLRALLKKAPRWIICAMWALVAIRLVCPISFASPVSAFRATPSIVSESGEVEVFRPTESSEKPLLEVDTVQIERPQTSAETISNIPGTSFAVTQRSRDVYLPPLVLFYLLGFSAMLLYAVISTLLLRKKVAVSLPQRENIRVCDEVTSPFILGVLRPVIYLPSSLSGEEKRYVLAHERAHLNRFDHLWKPLGFLILSVHWFNPFCWLAYVMLGRDIELACDEKVIRKLGHNERTAYSQTLLNCSARHILAACPVAFGETDVKNRVRAVLNYKKPAFWIILASLLGCLVLVVCFAANPAVSQKSEPTPPPMQETALPTLEPLPRQQEGTTTHRMTLDDVYMLANKGMDLTWADLLAFEGKEIGSSQLIWRFPIDDTYCLEAYDGELDGPPEHVLLLIADENGEFRAGPGLYIDILNQDIYAFLSGAHTRSITVTSNGKTKQPSLYLLYEKIWRDNGWLVADGPPLQAALTHPENISEVTLADDFTVRFDSYARKSGLQIYDEQYRPLREDWYGDTAVNWLAQGTYYCVIEVYGPQGRYIASEGASEESVYRAVFRLIVDSEGAEAYAPEKASGLTTASLHTTGGDCVLTEEFSKESLNMLESWLKNAEPLPGGTGCPFGSVLTLTRSDGSKISCCPAEDSCGVVFADGKYYRFADDNEDFWMLFDLQFPQ